jgi:uncharacterized protein YcbK (DUF882 family)
MKMKLYPDDTEVPRHKWPWEHFTPFEMRCKGSGKVGFHPPSMDKLQALRHLLGKPMVITSAYRSPSHNRRVGGASKSQHLKARAFDVVMKGHDPVEFERLARQVGFTSFGYYPNSNTPFMHIDTRKRPASWGPKFPSPN